AGERIHTRCGFIQEEDAGLVHDGGAESDALFPPPRQTPGYQLLLALQSRERQRPLTPGHALGVRNAIDAREEGEVFFDTQIVIQREFLRHVAELLADGLRAQAAGLLRELHLAGGGGEQSAQHLDRGGLAGAVGAEQAVDLAVLDVNVDVVHSGEGPEVLREVRCTDGDASAKVLVVMVAGKGFRSGVFSQGSQRSDECVLECRLAHLNVRDGHTLAAEQGFDGRPRDDWVYDEHIEAVAKPLHVLDLRRLARFATQQLLGDGQVRGPQFQSLRADALLDVCRRADPVQHALVHQRHAMAAFGFVQIRRRDYDRETIAREMSEHIPELPARDRVDAGRRLVQQQHARLGYQRTCKGELLLHATTEPSSEPVLKAQHVEHLEISARAARDVARRHAAQVADVPNVFLDSQFRVEAEVLREVAGLRPHLSRGTTKDLCDAGGGLHDPGEDLERRRFSGTVRADEAEDLTTPDVEIDAAYRLGIAVLLG